MNMADKLLRCHKCQESFVFSVAEQNYFASKGLRNDPKRCANCRILRRLESDGKDVAEYSNVVNCQECNALTVVPFRPRGNKPVYCAPCMHRLKEQNQIGDE